MTDHVSYQFLLLFIHSWDSVIYWKTDLISKHTLLLEQFYLNWASKMNISQTRNTIFAFTKPERKTISHFSKETRNTIFAGTHKDGATNNFTQPPIYRCTHVQLTGSDSHQICLPVFSTSGLQRHTFYTVLIQQLGQRSASKMDAKILSLRN